LPFGIFYVWSFGIFYVLPFGIFYVLSFGIFYVWTFGNLVAIWYTFFIRSQANDFLSAASPTSAKLPVPAEHPAQEWILWISISAKLFLNDF
jgi:hypothetical protein